MSLRRPHTRNRLTVRNCLTQTTKISRSVGQLTMRIGRAHNVVVQMHWPSSPHLLNVLTMMSSTYNCHTTLTPPRNQSYGMEVSTPFRCMDPSSTWHLTPRTSKIHLTLSLNILAINKSTQRNPVTFKTSRAWVRQSGILFHQSISRIGTPLSLTKIHTL